MGSVVQQLLQYTATTRRENSVLFRSYYKDLCLNLAQFGLDVLFNEKVYKIRIRELLKPKLNTINFLSSVKIQSLTIDHQVSTQSIRNQAISCFLYHV